MISTVGVLRKPGTGRDGGSLRRRLVAILCVPLIGMLLFSAGSVRQRVHTERASREALTLVQDAALIDSIRASFTQEVVPTVALSIMTDRPTMQALGIPEGFNLPLDAMRKQLAQNRQRTDEAVAAGLNRPSTAELVAAFRDSCLTTRERLSQGYSAQGMSGYTDAIALIRTLTDAEGGNIEKAARLGLPGHVIDRLNDVRIVMRAVALAGNEVPLYVTTRLETAAPKVTTQASVGYYAWYRQWGGFRTASDEVLTSTSPSTKDAWRTAMADPTVVEFDEAVSPMAAANAPGNATMVTALAAAKVLNLDAPRMSVLSRVLNQVEQAAVAAVTTQELVSRRELALILSASLFLLGVTIAGVIAATRSISRPLAALAADAQQVSSGELPEITVSGPREVRTVARALASASASLQRIQEAAEAVAKGDLDDQAVKRPLPGHLGEVVHQSMQRIVDAIQAKESAQAQLEYQAAHDALTALPNRSQVLKLIARSLQRAIRSETATCVMFVDLDHFKQVNDTHGHAVGDAVLQLASQRMSGVVRHVDYAASGDVVGRLGGDEFVVLLEDLDDDADVMRLAQRIIAAVGQPMLIGGREIVIGASVGVAVSRDGKGDASAMLRDADAAVYQAKQAGRGQVGFFDDDLRANLRERAALEEAILTGLRSGEFVLYYQPVTDLSSGAYHGVEALIRWIRPGFGLIPPDGFIPVAEMSALINDIGRWTLHEATAQLAAWSEDPVMASLTMAVNISGRHLASPQLVDDVRAALAASGVDPGQLILEITETVLVDDPRAIRNMRDIRQLGVRFALDDFGTGFTSIGQLGTMPIDILKIDRSFTNSAHPTHRGLVELMVTAAHTFDLDVVAEGIETAEQVQFMRHVTADCGQGYFFARPLPAADLAAAIASTVTTGASAT